MRHLFFDTNVLIDFLIKREPFVVEAAQLFTLSDQKKIKIYIAAVSLNTIYYIVRSSLSHQHTINLIEELSQNIEILDVNKSIINRALKSSFKDFEDAIQHYTAISKNEMGCIVTRDVKDYKNSEIPVFTPKEAISKIIFKH